MVTERLKQGRDGFFKTYGNTRCCVIGADVGAAPEREIPARPGAAKPFGPRSVRSKRSRFMTLFHAAAKSWTNFRPASALP